MIQAVRRTSVTRQKHRGGWAEVVACAWLLEQGYDVFRNVSATGPIDVVAVKGRETLYIDVKLLAVYMKTSIVKFGDAKVSKPRLTDMQVEAGIRALYVSPDGVCTFRPETLTGLYSHAFKSVLQQIEK